jgi:ribosome biogenesis protein SSF1/2
MAPALQVTHLLAFTLTDIAPSMRIVRLSNGPTLSFRVERYSLMKDIIASSRHAKSLSPIESMSAPLVRILFFLSPPSLPKKKKKLVLASFPPPGPTTPPHLTLVMKTFQTLFPPLAPHKLALSSARRVVLVAYNADRGTIDWRHFRITVKPYGVSRRVRRVLQGTGATVRGGAGGAGGSSGAVLDLGNEKDVADYVLRAHGVRGRGGASVEGGYETATSEVSSVAEGTDAEDIVSLAEDYVGRNNRRGQKRAVHLDEIGPRMELRLVKITEGVPGKEGAVIYHQFGEWQGWMGTGILPHRLGLPNLYTRGRGSSFFFLCVVQKTKTETAAQKEWHAAREKLRKERREEQDRNVRRKNALAGKTKANAVGATDEEGPDHDGGDGDDDDDNSLGDPSEDGDGGEASWDEEEEISEGEVSEDDARNEDRSSEYDDDDDKLPTKKKPKVNNR